MKSKTILTTIFLGMFSYITFLVFTAGLDNLVKNPIFAIFTVSSIFLLPATANKLLLKKSYFDSKYILLSLSFPAIYLLTLLLHDLLQLEVTLLYQGFSILLSTSFILSIIALLQTLEGSQYKKFLSSIAGFVAVCTLFLGINRVIGLEFDSLTSLDFLQHNAVTMEMGEGNLCLTPNQCSNLFKKLGYSSYFHTLQSIPSLGLDLPIGQLFSLITVLFSATSALVIYSLINKHTKNSFLCITTTISSLLVFDFGAYSFSYFIPQTVALLYFLIVINQRKIKPLDLAFVSLILIALHFIIGTYLVGILIFYTLFFQSKPRGKAFIRTILLLLIGGLIIAFIANLRGFSIERIFQTKDIETLGFATNYYFPENITYLAKQYGILLITALIATIYFGITGTGKQFTFFSSFYVLFTLTIYFIAPTYANKFLLGSSVFMAYLTMRFVMSLFKVQYIRFLFLELILIATLPLFSINSQRYMTFYRQNSGKISAIVKEDSNVVNFFKNNKSLSCKVISDPYTQLMIRSQSRYETAQAQYQSLDLRKSINEFISQPSNKTYSEVLKLSENPKRTCFIYNSRLSLKSKYVNPSNAAWINILYEYELSNDSKLTENKEISRFFNENGYKIAFADAHNVVFIED